MQTLKNKIYKIKTTRYLEDPDNGITLIEAKEEVSLFSIIRDSIRRIPAKEYMNDQNEIDLVKMKEFLDISYALEKTGDTDLISLEDAPYDKLMEITKKVVPSFVSPETYKMAIDLQELRDKRQDQKKSKLATVKEKNENIPPTKKQIGKKKNQ